MGPIKTEKASYENVLPTLPYPDPALAAMGKYPYRRLDQTQILRMHHFQLRDAICSRCETISLQNFKLHLIKCQ